MKKINIIYDSKFVDIAKLVNSLTKYVKECNIAVDSMTVEEIKIEKLQDYDLLAIGVSIYKGRISKSMSNLFEKLKKADIRHIKVFPFDNKLKYGFVGSTSKILEKNLKKLNMIIVRPYCLNIVKGKYDSTQERINTTLRRISADLARIIDT